MNVPRVVWAVVVGFVVARSGAFAQEPKPAPTAPSSPAKQDPTKSPPAAEVVRAAEERLQALAATTKDTKVLVANYVQRRTTKLAKEPLVSRGEFVFVKQPGCVVFRAKEPRESVTRLRADVYEVHRPRKKQLERFRLDGPELANGLFAALGGDTAALLRDFEVRSCAAEPEQKGFVRIVLSPRTPAIAERVSELSLVIATDRDTLAAVGYRDAAGDLVEIELQDVRTDPRDPPSVEFELAPDTAVIEHAAKKR